MIVYQRLATCQISPDKMGMIVTQKNASESEIASSVELNIEL